MTVTGADSQCSDESRCAGQAKEVNFGSAQELETYDSTLRRTDAVHLTRHTDSFDTTPRFTKYISGGSTKRDAGFLRKESKELSYPVSNIAPVFNAGTGFMPMEWNDNKIES